MLELIRMFKAVEVGSHQKSSTLPPSAIMKRAIRRGFVFAPDVIYHYTDEDLEDLIRQIDSVYGVSPEQLNATFHKSWEKVATASLDLLFLEQMVHYLTTYGFESSGVYSEESIFIPREVLEIPCLDEDQIPLMVIRGITRDEIKTRALDLLRSGIALSEQTMRDVIVLAEYVGVSQTEIQEVKNKEVKIALCDHLDMIPDDPAEFVRYLVFKATGNTLLIKNDEVIQALKDKSSHPFAPIIWKPLFDRYCNLYGSYRLAEVFHRFKPLFLSLRTDRTMRPTINKIRKLANRYHKPMKEDFLNSVTAHLKKGDLDEDRLRRELEKVNQFRKIRLAYALHYRREPASSIMYRVRNGKGYATGFVFEDDPKVGYTLDIVLNSIAEGVSLEGKKVFIPEFVRYALPATEKQFLGSLPTGTSIWAPDNMVFGVHWKDQCGYRVDLDLALMNELQKFGWDGAYRKEGEILFSGDMTAAPGDGAAESFHVRSPSRGCYTVTLNFFNYDPDVKVPYTMFVAREKPKGRINRNYTVDPNNVLISIPMSTKAKQRTLGLVTVDPEKGCWFHLSDAGIGASISSRSGGHMLDAHRYFSHFYRNTISLEDIMIRAGAEVVREYSDMVDIDLSPERITKDTILNLLMKEGLE